MMMGMDQLVSAALAAGLPLLEHVCPCRADEHLTDTISLFGAGGRQTTMIWSPYLQCCALVELCKWDFKACKTTFDRPEESPAAVEAAVAAAAALPSGSL